MRTVGAFEAKTNLSKLLIEVEKGEVIAISRHGKTVAILSPARESDSVRMAIESIKNVRKGVQLGKELAIKKLREQGRQS